VVLWSKKRGCLPNAEDGNFVLYGAGANAVWATHTSGNPGSGRKGGSGRPTEAVFMCQIIFVTSCEVGKTDEWQNSRTRS
jgi:hypothetical protein